jgi:putative transposase
MKKSRFSEEKIISILREADAGVKITELCRKHGMSDATFYKWKARYGGLEVSQLRRLKDLESENSRLKRMYAELSLTHQALQDAVEKKL